MPLHCTLDGKTKSLISYTFYHNKYFKKFTVDMFNSVLPTFMNITLQEKQISLIFSGQ